MTYMQTSDYFVNCLTDTDSRQEPIAMVSWRHTLLTKVNRLADTDHFGIMSDKH